MLTKLIRAACLAVCCTMAWGEDTPVNAPETPEVVTLEQAVQLALANNRDLMSSRIVTDIRKDAVALSKRPFQASVQPNGRAAVTDGSRGYFYGLGLDKQFLLGTRLRVESGYQSETVDGGESIEGVASRIDISQPLFRRFGRGTSLEPVNDARSDLLQSERLLLLRQAEIMLEVFRSYEQLLLLQRRIQSADASLARLDGLMELGKTREAQGRQTRVDSLRVELQRGQAEIRRENDRDQLAAERENFQDLLNVERPVRIDPQTRTTFDVALRPIEESVEQALCHRLDYANTLEALRDAERKLRITRRRILPDIELTMSYDRKEHGFSLNRGEDDGSWFAGLQLGSDYNVKDERLVIRQASSQRALAQLDVESMKFSIGRQVREAFRAYRRTRADQTISRRNVELASRRLELARTLFNLGRGDNFSVTDAENALVDAETAAFAAQAEASLSSYRVMHALGVLIEAPDRLKPERQPGAAPW